MNSPIVSNRHRARRRWAGVAPVPGLAATTAAGLSQAQRVAVGTGLGDVQTAVFDLLRRVDPDRAGA